MKAFATASITFAMTSLSIRSCFSFIASSSCPLSHRRYGGIELSKQHLKMSIESSTHTLGGKPIGGPLIPISNCILVRVQDKASESEGGVVLLGKSVERRTDGTVVAMGPGRKHQETGIEMPMPCSVGDKVLYGKFDGTALVYDGQDHQFVRDSDILFVYSGEKMTPETIKMTGDQVLVEVDEVEKKTESGLFLTTSDSEMQVKPTTGQVIAVGSGRVTSMGEILPVSLKPGDLIKFREFSGSEITMGIGSRTVYRVMKEEDVLVKW